MPAPVRPPSPQHPTTTSPPTASGLSGATRVRASQPQPPACATSLSTAQSDLTGAPAASATPATPPPFPAAAPAAPPALTLPSVSALAPADPVSTASGVEPPQPDYGAERSHIGVLHGDLGTSPRHDEVRMESHMRENPERRRSPALRLPDRATPLSVIDACTPEQTSDRCAHVGGRRPLAAHGSYSLNAKLPTAVDPISRLLPLLRQDNPCHVVARVLY